MPVLPQICTLRPEFDRMSLEDQDALALGCMAANEHRRRTAETLLNRCGQWIKDVE